MMKDKRILLIEEEVDVTKVNLVYLSSYLLQNKNKQEKVQEQKKAGNT
jgi:hypothetical protein